MAATILAAGLVIPSVAVAKQGPPTGEETGNNLSVPAIWVGSGGPALRGGPCGALVEVDGQPDQNVYPGYYLQKTTDVWQAQCSVETSASVTADWGDDLFRPVITTRSPLRIEMGLLADTTMSGMVVVNLTPDELDRNATYGTLGAVTPFNPVRVFDSGATLTIQMLDANGNPAGPPVYSGPMSAEINSIGAVVYGYNWGVQGRTNRMQAGTYKLTFETVGTTITACETVAEAELEAEPAPATCEFTAGSASVTIEILPGNNGGGGGGGNGGNSGNAPGHNR
jgi:hypothetical protein